MEKFKSYTGFYQITYDSEKEQTWNLLELKKAEINYKIAKDTLTNKINEFKKAHFYINIRTLPEYVYFLGSKELLKKVNKERTYIKNFIKNMNKGEEFNDR